MADKKIVNSSIAPVMFEYFEEICKIPHGSDNEAAIADYIVDFAQARDLECYRDEANNVLIRKAATKGREGEESGFNFSKNGGYFKQLFPDGCTISVDGDTGKVLFAVKYQTVFQLF